MMKHHVSRAWLDDIHARALLLTDSIAAWRFRRRFLDAGCAQVYVDDDMLDAIALRTFLRRWQPDLVLVSLHSVAADLCAIACVCEDSETAIPLFQIDATRWSRGQHHARICGERARIGGIVTLIRFLQGVRHEGTPCVDLADLGAWLAESYQTTIIFAATRWPKPGLTTARMLRDWLDDRMRILDEPITSAFCIDTEFDHDVVSSWQSIHDALCDIGTEPAFGAIPARVRPRTAARRLLVGLNGIPTGIHDVKAI